MNTISLFDQPTVEIVEVMDEKRARRAVEEINAAGTMLYVKLAQFKKMRGYEALGYDNLPDCIRSECPFFKKYATQTIYHLASAGEVAENIGDILQIEESAIRESQLRPIAHANLQPEQQREVWQQAVETAPNGKVTAAHVERTVQTYKSKTRQMPEPPPSPPARKYDGPQVYTMAQWQALSEHERGDLLEAKGTTKFNETNENVEWALWTWNPITGCLHNCPYCYARDIANRFYSYLPDDERFSPAFYPERLSCPSNTRVPDLSQVDDPVRRIGLRNVFTCSMADLFGKWVPSEWIHAVLRQVADNPQWTFLFLSKFPIRMAEFDFPPNTWIGTTVDTQYAVERAEKAFRKIRAGGYEGVAWLSCEPMMERLTFTSLDMFDWVVVGGSSKSTQTPEFKPPFEWINHLWNQAKTYNLPVYMKTNLGIEQRVREYPIGE
jgi:protein gp37